MRQGFMIGVPPSASTPTAHPSMLTGVSFKILTISSTPGCFHPSHQRGHSNVTLPPASRTSRATLTKVLMNSRFCSRSRATFAYTLGPPFFRLRTPGSLIKKLHFKKLKVWIPVTNCNFLTRGEELEKHISKNKKFETSTYYYYYYYTYYYYYSYYCYHYYYECFLLL